MVEYVIHGVLGHAHRTFVTGLHEVHHRDPRAVFALGSWVPVAAAIVGAWWMFGAAPGVIFLGGVAAGFAGYELIHYRIHFSRPSCGFEERLRARHLAHHFKEPDAIFGMLFLGPSLRLHGCGSWRLWAMVSRRFLAGAISDV